MAKDKLEDWDEVAANNLDMGGISLAENVMRPPAVNNEMREHMAQVSKWLGDDTIVAASSIDIGALPGRYISVTGNTTITAFGTVKAGTVKYLKFTGTPTITYNATSMILPGAVSIVVTAGDTAIFVSEGSGNWRCVSYQRTTGAPAYSAATKIETFRQRVVNGDMMVSQENGTIAGTTNGYYAADQFATYRVTSAGVITSQRVASVTPAGSPYRYRVTITTADASLAAGEYLTITTNLEGSNVCDFQYGSAAAKAGVVRFGFKGPAGTYAARIGNSAANRSFIALFTISGGQANTDTVQNIAVTGDVTGTWLTADGVIGMTLEITLACGSTFQGVAGWQSGLILGTSGVSNGMGTVSAVFELFDVGFKMDPDATGVYGQYEIQETDAVYRSERYVARINTLGFTGVVANGIGAAVCRCSVQVRLAKAPTSLANSGNVLFGDGFTNVEYSSIVAGSSTRDIINFTPGTIVTGTFNTAGRPVVGLSSGDVLAFARLS